MLQGRSLLRQQKIDFYIPITKYVKLKKIPFAIASKHEILRDKFKMWQSFVYKNYITLLRILKRT